MSNFRWPIRGEDVGKRRCANPTCAFHGIPVAPPPGITTCVGCHHDLVSAIPSIGDLAFGLGSDDLFDAFIRPHGGSR